MRIIPKFQRSGQLYPLYPQTPAFMEKGLAELHELVKEADKKVDRKNKVYVKPPYRVPEVDKRTGTRFGVARDHLQGMMYNAANHLGIDLDPVTHTNKDYSEQFNKSGENVAKIALRRHQKLWKSLKEGETKLMRDSKKGAKDGGITGSDFREYNKPFGGGYARFDLSRYGSAFNGGRYSFEYGPGGSNLEVTNYSPDSLYVRVFDNNNFDNSTLSLSEMLHTGPVRWVLGKLIGTGGKKVKRDLTYKIAKEDVTD